MKKYLFFIGIILTLSSCAFIEGMKNEKNVVPIPPGEKPAATEPSTNIESTINQATVQAAKTITPVAR